MDIKPRHKFNNGMGATLCHRCCTIITTEFTDDLICKPCQKQTLIDLMKADEEDGLYDE